MCAFHGVDLWDLRGDEKTYSFCLGRIEYALYEELRKKTAVQSEIIRERGVPHFLARVRKNLTFFLGALVAGALIIVLSQFIWSIQIEGNSGYGTEELMRFLKEQDVIHGMSKHGIVCSKLAASFREEFPNITWVSAKIEGCRLIIEMKENILDKELKGEDTPKEENPSNLIAEKDGVVVSMVTRTGVPKVAVGSECKKGDVLVEGIVPIYNDSQEVVRYEHVVSDGDIDIRTTYQYYDEFSRTYEDRVYKESKKGIFLSVGPWLFGDDFSEPAPGELDKVRTYRQARLTKTFGLPIRWGSVENRHYEIEEKYYTEKEAKALAEAHFLGFQENLEKIGVQICGNDVKIDITDGTCRMKGTVTVIEETGKLTPFTPMEQPSQELTQEE